MEGLEQEFKRFNENINREIIQNPNFVTATASGRMRESVLDSNNVTIQPTRFVKRVQGYAEFIDRGRGPGGMPPLQAILDWLEYEKYGFAWKPDIRRRNRLAWALRISIAKKGSSKHKGSVPKTDIFDNAIEEAFAQLRIDLTKKIRTVTRNNLRTELGTIKKVTRK